jgi:hypothetical protein
MNGVQRIVKGKKMQHHPSKLATIISIIAPLCALIWIAVEAGDVRRSTNDTRITLQETNDLIKIDSRRLSAIEIRNARQDILDSVNRGVNIEIRNDVKELNKRMSRLEDMHNIKHEETKGARPYSLNLFKEQLEMPK